MVLQQLYKGFCRGALIIILFLQLLSPSDISKMCDFEMEGIHFKTLFSVENLEFPMEAIADAILRSEKQFSYFSLASARFSCWRGAFCSHNHHQLESLAVRNSLFNLVLSCKLCILKLTGEFFKRLFSFLHFFI